METRPATSQIVGKRIIGMRTLRADELDAFMWDRRVSAHAISLDDGTEIIATADTELNGPSAFVALTGSAVALIEPAT